MAFTEKELAEVTAEIEVLIEVLRPAMEIRNELDYTYEVDQRDASIVIMSIQPQFMNPLAKTRMSIAKVKYSKSKENWTVYWERANGKWEKYPEEPVVSNLKQFFRVLKADKLCCFFG